MHPIRRISAACALAFLAMLVAVGVMGVPGMADYAPYIARGLCGAALICGIVYFSMRSHAPSGAMFSSGSVAASTSNKRFSDVAANANAKHSLLELCDYLKNPDKYRALGAVMPRGVLLYGPPGTGKTLLARALAGEAGVPFYAMSGSDFVEMYAGVGAGRVRSLFQKARKDGRCVIFIDEIDALGKSRSATSSDERDQTLNALLCEMSGFSPDSGVLVIAATNRPDMLDAALTRPGRFDRQIEVGLPGREERLAILKLVFRNRQLAGDVALARWAERTVTFSGAALECLANEAALLAVARAHEAIDASDMEEAYVRAVAGAPGQRCADERTLRTIAIHEAGHALASRLLQPQATVARVSILPGAGGAAGYNLTIPEEKQLHTRGDLTARIGVLLAGRAAEMLKLGAQGVSTGASQDLKQATAIAREMIAKLGMGDACYRVCDDGEAAQREMDALLKRCFDDVTALIERNADRLDAIVQALLERETLDADGLDALVTGAA